MTMILTAFSLFHLALGLACIAAGLRLRAREERALWRAPLALLSAELLVWVYPLLALAASRTAWRQLAAGDHNAIPMIIAPLAWLVLMGVVFAIVDFAEDGVLGNARRRSN